MPCIMTHEAENMKRAACAARAAAITWCALATCRGYSAQENPAFWKRVFCDLHPKRRTLSGPVESQKATPVRDSIAFFDRNDAIFPRVMVALQGHVSSELTDSVLECFCGESSDSRVEALLDDLLFRLTVIFDNETVQRDQAMDLCLSIPSSALPRVSSELPATVHKMRSLPARDRRTTCSFFQLKEIRIEGLTKLDDDNDIESFTQLLDHTPIPVRPSAISSKLGDITASGFASVLRSTLGSVHSPSTLAFKHDRLPDAAFQALCSALPFSTSMQSLSLSVQDEVTPFESLQLPWIAYAIFHPHAERSSWRHLELRDLVLTPKAEQVLNAMARGNNLLPLLTGEKPTNDAYVSAVLEAESVVYWKPSEDAEVMSTVSTSKEIEVDVCGSPSSGDWTAVIVPAYGLGWVHSRSLKQIQRHTPSSSQLHRLGLRSPTQLSSMDTSPQQTVGASLEPFIHVLGPHLTYLDIRHYGAAPVSSLQQITASCPRLCSLRIEVAGSPGGWTLHSQALRELDLRMTSQDSRTLLTQLLIESLQNLHALRVSLIGLDQFVNHQAFLPQLLARATTLRYLHWQSVRRLPEKAETPLGYAFSRRHSTEMVHRLKLPHKVIAAVAQGPFSADCALAILSAVAQMRQQYENAQTAPRANSAMGRLHKDVLRLIFQFATSPVPRTICVDHP